MKTPWNNVRWSIVCIGLGVFFHTLVFAESLPITILLLNTQQEYVLITNEGDTAINLEGWTLHDHDYGKGSVYSYTFTEMLLQPGEILHMQSGKSGEEKHETTHNHAECTYYIRWSDRNVWNNGCDIAYVVDDRGTLISEKHSGKEIDDGKREQCK